MTLATEWTTIRDNAVTLISAIDGIGNVYGYMRYTPSADDFKARFYATINGVASVRAWVVTLSGMTIDVGTFDDWDVTATLTAEGWLSLKDTDATEQTFIGLCQQVLMTLANEQQFGSSAVIDDGRVTLEGPSLVMFPPGDGGALCHYARITKTLTLDQTMVWT